MSALLQEITYSLCNQVKVSLMECFSSPSLTVVSLSTSILALFLNPPKSYFVCMHCAHTDLSVA